MLLLVLFGGGGGDCGGVLVVVGGGESIVKSDYDYYIRLPVFLLALRAPLLLLRIVLVARVVGS